MGSFLSPDSGLLPLTVIMAIKSDAPPSKDVVKTSNGVEQKENGSEVRQMPVTLLSGFLVRLLVPRGINLQRPKDRPARWSKRMLTA